MDSINDALIECIKACGGSKVVGPQLWPEKLVDAAQRTLLDCLNEDRPAKLAPEQVLLIFRLARAKGCHVGMEFFCSELGYCAPTPMEPRDEVADLMRSFNESVAHQSAIAARIEKAAGRLNLRNVA